MAKTFKNYDVFISSPSDVAMERDIVQDAIEQLNQIRGLKEGFRLNPLRWEKDVSSQFGVRPQDVINEQIGENYDIFIGILCSRFGTKTDCYDSGTEEEFFRAFERNQTTGGTPEISFFFKDARASEDPIDADQFQKVSKFKKRIENLGVYENFERPESLKALVLAALVKCLDRLESKVPTQNSTLGQKECDATSLTESPIVQVSDFDEDIGLMDLIEMVFDAVEAFSEKLEAINTATVKLGERMQVRTHDIENFKPSGDARNDQKAAKNIVEKVAAEMHRYCHVLDQSVPDAKREFLSALRCMEHAVIISDQDGLASEKEVQSLVDELLKIQIVLETVLAQVSNFRDTISDVPRMTSKLNQAKRRTVDSLNDFLRFLSEAYNSSEVTLETIMR